MFVADSGGSAYSLQAGNQAQYGSIQRYGYNPNYGNYGGQTSVGGISQGIETGLPYAGAMLNFVSEMGKAKEYKLLEKSLKQRAQQAMQQGIEQGRDISDEGTAFLGEMTTIFGKSGTLLEGSPLLALADTTREIEKNVMRSIEQGRREKEALDFQARQAKRAGYMTKVGAIGNLVGSVVTLGLG